MFQSKLIKILLSPLSLLYGVGVSLRGFFYKHGLLKGIEFDVPTISVGNLSVGGAGKSPHIEYLVQLLRPYINVATLSRGYKRKSKGYLTIQRENNAETAGDEPLQFKRKFPDIHVAVAENRTFAVPKILMEQPDTQVILLDDAFQHRSIKPGLNILLTEYSYPFTEDYLLPSGRLREWRSAYRRADVLIVSKCPPTITEEEKKYYINELKPFPHQRIYFSYYEYQHPYYILDFRQRVLLEEDVDVLLICAIARSEYLVEYLESKVKSVKVMEYEDHRYFSKFDVSFLKTTFDKMESKKKIIITTEKDAMRLQLHQPYLQENRLPIFSLPIQVAFHYDEKAKFDEQVKQFLLNFKV